MTWTGSSFERRLLDLVSKPLFFTGRPKEEEEKVSFLSIDRLHFIEYALIREIIIKKGLYQTGIPKPPLVPFLSPAYRQAGKEKEDSKGSKVS
jgi:hypothetical protein